MAQQDSEIRTAFRDELSELRDTVLRMATFVEGMLARSLEALVNQDAVLAEEVRRSDDVADRLDMQIEQQCIRLLALQQPLARDLRAVTASLRIAADLERIGDYSKDIAKATVVLAPEPYHWPLEDIPAMGRLVGEMVRTALRCFVDRNLDLAREVALQDKQVDEVWRRLRDQLMEHMREDPRHVSQATYLLLVARYLERIGDHTVNVVERVNYMETGQTGHVV